MLSGVPIFIPLHVEALKYAHLLASSYEKFYLVEYLLYHGFCLVDYLLLYGAPVN